MSDPPNHGTIRFQVLPCSSFVVHVGYRVHLDGRWKAGIVFCNAQDQGVCTFIPSQFRYDPPLASPQTQGSWSNTACYGRWRSQKGNKNDTTLFRYSKPLGVW